MKINAHLVSHIVLFILLFVFWMALTASFSLVNIALGLASTLFVNLLVMRLIGGAVSSVFVVPNLAYLPVFAFAMLWEIVKANIDVAVIVLNPALPISPRIFEYHTYLKGDLAKTVFTYCINLTPGTVTVDIKGDVLYVQGLAQRQEDGLKSGHFEKMVACLFGQKRLKDGLSGGQS